MSLPASASAADRPPNLKLSGTEAQLLDAGEASLREHPELFFYVCENAFDQQVLRASRKPLPKPDGRHPDAPAAIRDVVVDGIGAAAAKYLEGLCTAHNAAAQKVAKKGAAERPARGADERPKAGRPAAAAGGPAGRLGAAADGELQFAATGMMDRFRELYFHVCPNEAGKLVLRATKKPTEKPDGAHPDPVAGAADLPLDALSAPRRAFVEAYARNHNEAAARVAANLGPNGRPLPFGVAPIGGFAPPPAGPPEEDPLPAAATKNAEQARYAALARLVSQDFKLGGRHFDFYPKAAAVLQAAEGAPEEQLKQAAGVMAAGLDQEERLFKERLVRLDERKRSAERMLQNAREGRYVRTETYLDYDASGNLREFEVQHDDSHLYMLVAQNASMMANNTSEATLAEDAAIEARGIAERSRARAWDHLLPLAEKFAGAVSAKPLVELRYEPGPIPKREPHERTNFGFSQRFAGKHVATNVSGKTLHNVSLAVDFVHFSTAPDATLRHVYFLPTWKAGAAVELSRYFFQDPKRAGVRYHVPLFDGNRNEDRGPEVEFFEMAGVVRLDASVWADEARQATVRTDSPKRAAAVFELLLEAAEKEIASPHAVAEASPFYENLPAIKMVRAAQAKRGEKPKTPTQLTQAMVAQLLRPIPEVLPADSEMGAYARKLIADFRPLREQVLKKRQADLLASFAPGRRYEGTSGGFSWPKFGLLFVACDAKGEKIRAELYDPDKPEALRPLAGSIDFDARLKQKVLVLKPVAPTQGEPNQPNNPASPFSNDLSIYQFRFENGQLVGRGDRLGGAFNTAVGLALDAADEDPKQLAAAQQRVKENPGWKIPTDARLPEMRGRGGLPPGLKPPVRRP